MTTYPNINNEPELLKIKTRDEKIKTLNIKRTNTIIKTKLKSPKIDNECYKKKYNSLNKKKILLIITEILIGSRSAIGSSTMGLFNPGAGINNSSGTAFVNIYCYLNH